MVEYQIHSYTGVAQRRFFSGFYPACMNVGILIMASVHEPEH